MKEFKKQPLVSVVIPCYNPGKYLIETVTSVENQDYANFEIIIIDDGSTDEETKGILEQFRTRSGIKVYYQENAGPGVARNFGVAMAGGDYIVFLDSDDLIRKHTINAAIKVLEKYPDTGVVYGNIQLFQNKNELKVQRKFNRREMLFANQISVLSVVRKQAFLDAGGYDTFTSRPGFLEDYELWLSMAETKWEFHYINDTFFDYRILAESRTSRNLHEKEDVLRYIYKKHCDMLFDEYCLMYHDLQNLKETLEYMTGNVIIKPFRLFYRFLLKKK